MEAKAPVKITVAGKITDAHFHKCVAAARYLERENPGTVTAECLQFFETQWEEFLKKTANKLKGVFYQHSGNHLIYLDDGEYIGSSEKFATYALHNFAYMDNSTTMIYEKKATDCFRKMINQSKTRKYASMDINFSGMDTTVIFELFHDIAPRTCANFLGLCEGHARSDGEVMTYQGTEIHRIVKGMYIQCGRVVPVKSPELGTNLYGGEFEDESFQIKHTDVGMLGMCKRNGLKHTNEAQFYVTTGAPLSFLDNQNVVFGRVVQGMRAFKLIEKLETTNEKPNDPVKITKAGAYSK